MIIWGFFLKYWVYFVKYKKKVVKRKGGGGRGKLIGQFTRLWIVYVVLNAQFYAVLCMVGLYDSQTNMTF